MPHAVELGLKKAERIEKILNVSEKLKANDGVQTDISRANTRLCLVIADRASDEENSVAMMQEYVMATVTLRRDILSTRRPPIRSPHWLSLPLRFLRIQPLAVPLVVFIIDILAIAESNYTEYPITSSILVRRRHKMHKPSNDAAFERLKDWLFLPELTACAGSPFGL